MTREQPHTTKMDIHAMHATAFRRKTLAQAICAASAVLPFTVIAEVPTQSKQELALEEIRVTATREPGNMLLDAAELAKIQAITMEDIFSFESSVAVGGGSVNAQKIYVRGFEDVMLNVTVDGAQTPGELYHHQSRVQLEPEFVKTVQLDAGAGVATNGSGALTGSLAVTLKEAEDYLEPGKSFGALAKGSGEFNGEDGQKYTGAVYGRVADSVGLVLGYTNEDRDEYEDGNGDLVDTSGYEHERGFAKLDGDFGNHSLSLTYESIDDEAITYERPNLSNFRGTYLLSEQELSRETAAFNYDFDPSTELVDTHVTLFSNDNDFRVQRLESDTIYGEGDFQSYGGDARNTMIFGDNSLTYGVDYRKDEVTSAQNATPPFAWGTSEQTGEVFGVYIQDNWVLFDNLDLSFGVRYDDYEFSGEGGVSEDVSISDDGLSPNISADWEIINGLHLRAAYAKAFRGVTIREAFFSALYVHDGTLESEEADNAELGISYANGPFFINATAYQQNIENFIDAEYVGEPGIWGYWRNVGDAEVEGYELETGFNLENLSLSVGVWDIENELNGEPLTDANLGLGTSVGRTWLGKVDYYFTEFDVNVGTNVRFVESEPNKVADGAPDKKAYSVVNFYANWMITDGITFSAALNNMFDKFYYDHATYTWLGDATGSYVGFPSKGREFRASLTFQF